MYACINNYGKNTFCLEYSQDKQTTTHLFFISKKSHGFGCTLFSREYRGVARSLEQRGGRNFENLEISKTGGSQCPFLYIK